MNTKALESGFKRGLTRKLGIGLIHIYQGIRAGRPSPCRFYPSCSTYAVEAVEIHGLVKGSWLTAKRIIRCRPRGGFGFDPVPVVSVDTDHFRDHLRRQGDI